MEDNQFTLDDIPKDCPCARCGKTIEIGFFVKLCDECLDLIIRRNGVDNA